MKRFYENPEDNLAFERCIDVMSQLMLKYGPRLLRKQRFDAAKAALPAEARKFVSRLEQYWNRSSQLSEKK